MVRTLGKLAGWRRALGAATLGLGVLGMVAVATPATAAATGTEEVGAVFVNFDGTTSPAEFPTIVDGYHQGTI